MAELSPGNAAAKCRAAQAPPEPVLEQVRDALRGLRFGSVTIIVQDGVVVQLERTERRRFSRPES